MSWNHPAPLLALPDELSDRTVAELLELLYALAAELESHYAAQLHRYYRCDDAPQAPLWRDDDTPF